MKDKLSRILNILVILLMVISVVIAVIFYLGTGQFASDAEFSVQIDVLGGRLDTFLNWAIILTIGTALAAILFPILGMVTDPKNSKKTLIMVASMVIVVLVAYGVASDAIPHFNGYQKFFYDDITMDPNQFSKYVDAGLWTMYILSGLSLLSIVYYEVGKLLK
ncbi:MAG: hypothetical protein K9H64_14620 [Bacteroidales bacterium]|nr:hypothetical protein [Bacteroidales bacterium]MCF8457192.1 hypothetical protein [Bacteroidales bacterium]